MIDWERLSDLPIGSSWQWLIGWATASHWVLLMVTESGFGFELGCWTVSKQAFDR